LSCIGCATLLMGKNETADTSLITIYSTPPGAEVYLDGRVVYQYKHIVIDEFASRIESRTIPELTPLKVSLLKYKKHHIKLLKEGYEPFETEIKPSFNSKSLLNAVNFIGWHVDSSSGSTTTLKPKTLRVKLWPIESKTPIK
jgi:hypothetical protein